MFSKKIHYIPPKDSIQNTVYSIQNTVYRIQYTEYSIQIKVKIKNSLKLNSESRIMSTDFHISILTFYFKKSRIFYIILTAVHKIQDTGYRIQDTGYRIQFKKLQLLAFAFCCILFTVYCVLILIWIFYLILF